MSEGVDVRLVRSETDARWAKESSRVLAAHIADGDLLRIRLLGPKEETIGVPVSAVQLLVRILDEMGKGNAVAVIPVRPEITTQEAAEMLGISRPSLIQLLDEGRISFRKVKTHRRVRLDSLLAYQRRLMADRKAVLAELAAYDQELGI